MTRRTRTTLAAGIFLLPNFAGFLVFVAWPIVYSLGASFTNWSLTSPLPARFVGLSNYRDLLASREFWTYTVNTLYFMMGMPLSIAASLALALLLSQRVRGLVVYRTLFYLPSFTSGVALFILWKALFNPNFGPINLGLDVLFEPIRHFSDMLLLAHAIGAHGPERLLDAAAPGGLWWVLSGLRAPAWLTSADNLIALEPALHGWSWERLGLGARDAIVIMGIWTTMGGANMLLYLAGIANIPPELYEAAAIDGAGPWRRFRHITWPQLAPTTFFIAVMSLIAGLQGGFEQARVMTEGGPAGTTVTLSYFIYNKAFEEFEAGYASAISWVLFAAIFAVTMVHWRYGRGSAGE